MATEIITKEDLQTFKGELIAEIKSIFTQPLPGQKEWLKSEDVRELLTISPGSLQNLRIKGILPFSKVGGTLYYKYSDVMKVLEENKTEAR